MSPFRSIRSGRTRAGIPCGCLLILLPFYMIVAGWQGLHEALAFRQPVVISYEQFVRRMPQQGWFLITGGEMNVLDSAWETSSSNSSSVSSIYVPVHAAGKRDEKFTSLLLTTQEPGVTITVEKLARLAEETGSARSSEDKDTTSSGEDSDNGSSETKATDKPQSEHDKKVAKWKYVAFLQQNADRLFVKRDLEGMVQAGINASESTRKEIAGLQGNLAPNFVILEEGKKPSLGFALFMSIGGIGILLVPISIGIISALAKSNQA